ncbi:MAG: hypothetical protein O3A82_06130 [Verrucomicrobia bacterium]|nr:hypothetical protein [Verrucomicrobiota bacterium]
MERPVAGQDFRRESRFWPLSAFLTNIETQAASRGVSGPVSDARSEGHEFPYGQRLRGSYRQDAAIRIAAKSAARDVLIGGRIVGERLVEGDRQRR